MPTVSPQGSSYLTRRTWIASGSVIGVGAAALLTFYLGRLSVRGYLETSYSTVGATLAYDGTPAFVDDAGHAIDAGPPIVYGSKESLYGTDTSGNTDEAYRLEATLTDRTAGSEDGQAEIKLPIAGAMTTVGKWLGTGLATVADLAVNGEDITCDSASAATVFDTNATSVSVGGAGDVNLSGGSSSTGCTVTGSTGALECSGGLTVGGVGLVTVTDSATTTPTTVLKIRHSTTGTAGTGYATVLSFEGEDSAGNTEEMGQIRIGWTDATSTSEDSYLAFHSRAAGAGAEESVRLGGTYPVSVGATGGNGIAMALTSATGPWMMFTDAGVVDWAFGTPDGSGDLCAYEGRFATNPGTERLCLADSTGALSVGGGSANKAVCWKADGKTLGYCSTVVDANGACTCN